MEALNARTVTSGMESSSSNGVAMAVLDAQLAQIGREALSAREKILQLYPVGSQVEVFLSSKQKVPTPAKVLEANIETGRWSARAWGYVRCRMLTGTGLVRDVELSNIAQPGEVRP